MGQPRYVQRWRSCSGSLPVAAIAPPGAIDLLAGLLQQILDELGRLQFVELFHADTEKLLRHTFHLVLVEAVVMDQPGDEALLTLGAVPVIVIGTVAIAGRR
jgi:hypothetical protein